MKSKGDVFLVLGLFDATAGTFIMMAHRGYGWLITFAYIAAFFRFNQWRTWDDEKSNP